MLSQDARLSDCLSDRLASIFSPITDFSPTCLHHCKHLIKVSHRIALRLCSTSLAPIFDRPVVELQCSCNFYRSVLSGDVDLRWELVNVWNLFFMQNSKQYFPLDCNALRLRTFVTPFRYTGSGIRMQYWRLSARPVRRCTRTSKRIDAVWEIVYAKGDAKFPIGLHGSYVAPVWRQFSTDRKWNCSAVLWCAGVSWTEMYISGEVVLRSRLIFMGCLYFECWMSYVECRT